MYLCLTVGVLLNIRCSEKCLLAKLQLLLMVPFPLLVVVQQVVSIFIVLGQMEAITTFLFFGERALEASPQLLILIFIILADSKGFNWK